MSVEQNKALVHAYFQAITENRMADAWRLIADDVVWAIGGHSPLAGTYTREQLAELQGAILARIVGGIRIDVGRVIGEGDLVAAELTSAGKLSDGRVYNNNYLFMLTIKDGKFWRCTEYLDTYHYVEVFGSAARL
jgi:ketosteroid isomerase-like protein